MVSKQADTRKMPHPGKKTSSRNKLLRRIIHPRNHWHTDFNGYASFIEPMQISKDTLVAPSGQTAVQFRVHCLEVVEKNLRIRKHRFERLPQYFAAGIHGARNVFCIKQSEEFGAEFRMQQWLSAGNSNAAVIRIKKTVSKHFAEYCVNRHLLSIEGERIIKTRFNTASAANTVFSVNGMAFPNDMVTMTDDSTGTAANAFAQP